MKTPKLYLSDSRDILPGLDEGTLDAMVTDPPAGISFMGKAWDQAPGGRDGWVEAMVYIFKECLTALRPGAHAFVWALPRTSHWTATALENAGFEVRDIITHIFGTGFPKSLDIGKAIDKAAGAEREVVGVSSHYCAGRNVDNFGVAGDGVTEQRDRSITAPATDAARQWDGWGTGLKPAAEHWILCRKPLSEKTVASNVLRHGTGGINIEASRVPTKDSMIRGRFPANLIHDGSDEVVDGFPVTVARFFYCAKASRSERNAGCEGMPESGGQSYGSIRQDRGAGYPETTRATNHHPTVKPIALMRYLCRMITPRGGTVLDPFMGSGSTGVAAIEEGFNFIGIEKDPGYFEIAEKRIGAVVPGLGF